MTARLVAIDRPGGPAFVDRLRSVWDDGDAAFVVDQRLPVDRRRALREALGVDREVLPGDALVVATSGSTGEPKGVVLTHDAVASSAVATSARLAVREDDHWLACLPLSHVGGLSVVTRALHLGTTLTVLSGFDAAAVERAARGGATLVSLVPTALARIDPSLFRTIVLGGSRPPADRPANTVTTYGLTETGSGVVYDGVPLAGVEVRLADDGEILLRGPMLLRCYRRLTASGAIDERSPIDGDGWLATGDLGRWVESDGGTRLHVDGRRGDLIITGGENVWPEQVEAILARHPAIDEVLVRGVADAEWGQLVEAVVVPADGRAPPTLEELRSFVKSENASFLAPRRLELTTALDRTALGKPRRQR